LQHALFHSSKENLVGLQGLEVIKRPGLLDASLELKMHDERILPSQKVYKQLHKDVQNICLVAKFTLVTLIDMALTYL
jgi:hypothetical protein